MTAPAIITPPLSVLHIVGDAQQVGGIVNHALVMARGHGLPEDAVDRLRIVVSELATNIAKHAGQGQIIFRAVGEPGAGWIEVLALDKGPGIARMARAMRDGASPDSAARHGGGLAGVRCVADLFDVYSQPAKGTAVVAHVGAPSGKHSGLPCAGELLQECIGVVCVAMHGERSCGDSWAVDCSPGRMAALLVDGLGHGPEAAVAAFKALGVFDRAADTAPELQLAAMHTALHRTRGAAISLAVIGQPQRTVRFCGVGNVDGRLVTATTNLHLIPQNGIVGHTMPAPQPADVDWPTNGRLVLHSDGISSNWRPENYPGLIARHPALLAGVLFRDFARVRDDATVLVVRDPIPAQPA